MPRGGVSLIFPKVPPSSLGILRVPQLPPLRKLTFSHLKNEWDWKTILSFWGKRPIFRGYVQLISGRVAFGPKVTFRLYGWNPG